jgi:hypothetical protein
MDCKTAQFLLDMNRPAGHELDAEEARALELHLDHCPDCSGAARTDSGFHQQVGLAMRQVAIPPDLRGRVLARLDRERGDYYRKQAARGIRVAAALAACIVVALVIWRIRTPERPSLDLAQLRSPAMGVHCDAQTRKDAERWFADNLQIEVEAPSQFNYALLLECGLADCQGKKVPCLTFVRPDVRATARVYIVRDDQFNTNALGNSSSLDGGAKAEISRPDGASFIYVIIYNSDRLEDFLNDKVTPVT